MNFASYDQGIEDFTPFMLCPICLKKSGLYFGMNDVNDIKIRNIGVIQQLIKIKLEQGSTSFDNEINNMRSIIDKTNLI